MKRSGMDVPSTALFGVLYADPPWDYPESGGGNRVVSAHYPTMTAEDICALRVPAADNAVLYLWATAPKLREALAVISAWGFEYKTHAVWDKELIGMGYWFRGQHDLLMLGIRGKVTAPPPELRIGSVIRARRSKHSAKPDTVRDLIGRWFPNERKLELFARPWTDLWPKHDGWETWGNEMANDVELSTPNATAHVRDRSEAEGT